LLWPASRGGLAHRRRQSPADQLAQNESILAAANAKDIRLLWKVKLDNEPRQLHSLFPPLIMEKLRTPSGVRQVAIDAGVSDNIYGIDVADGKLLWKKHFTSIWTPPATGRGGGGNPNMVYAFDLATGKVGSWGPAGGGMWGRSGPAISSTGVMYTGAGDGNFNPEIGAFGNGIIGVKQNPETKALDLVDYFAPTNAAWLWKRDLDMQVTPAIFKYRGHELMVDAGKEGRVFLMDTESIGGDDHRTPLYGAPLLCNEDVNFASAGIRGSMATWEDAKGTRWVLTPFWGAKHSGFTAPIEYGEMKNGAIAAFKVEQKNGKWQLTPAWISRDMNRAEPPVIANGVVFAYGNGEDTDQACPDAGLADTTDRRIPGSTHAVLYALDAETGKELWSSGDQIKSWNHWSGITVANGRIYIGTYDSNLYCFGITR
jgi:outer membrane protein assembly factor BamB